MPPTPAHTSPRLIESYFPVNETSIEAIRERAGAIPNPAPHQLHVWWARRPLAISRAAVAASLLNADADRDEFLGAMGTHKGIVQEAQRIAAARETGERLKQGYSMPRSFTHNPTPAQAAWLQDNLATPDPLALDVTAGGGSIPFEAGRLGLRTIANELNPVAALILRATCEWPQKHGAALLHHFGEQQTIAAQWTGIAGRFLRRVSELTEGVYPPEPQPAWMANWNDFHAKEICSNNEKTKIVRAQRLLQCNLWARTVACPSCGKEIPLSPNWRLTGPNAPAAAKPKTANAKNGKPFAVEPTNNVRNLGVKLLPDETSGKCGFEIVEGASNQSAGTIARGTATCPYPSCGATTPRGYVAAEAGEGRMGHILYATIFQDRWQEYTKTGSVKKRLTTQRGFRAATPEDDNAADIQRRLAELKPKWDAEDILPTEQFPTGNDNRPIIYGMSPWYKMFSPRQQLAHGLCVQAYRELVDEDRANDVFDDERKAAWCYIALALDKLIDYNSCLCAWHANRGVIGHIFATHDFGMKWSYPEMTVANWGWGLEWAISDMRKCIGEVVDFTNPEKPNTAATDISAFGLITEGMLTPQTPPETAPAAAPSVILNDAAQALDMDAASVDAVIFDPPYHDNVNYAELSDFFFVWLKRTAGYALGDDFPRIYLTDKTNEAIASPARFRAQAAASNQGATAPAKSARVLATDDYHAKMREIFGECRRVIKPDGIMTVMFTHKSTAAWDALTMALIESGFAITRTWPVKTEAESSLHIRDQAAARSTILLVCRPMQPEPFSRNPNSWEDVEVLIADAVRQDIQTLRTYGLTPVDMHLAAFGPALRIISENWGVERDQAHPERFTDLFIVTPTDAMQVARREVMAHRVQEISQKWAEAPSDTLTRFYILAQDGLGAAVAPFGDANLFAIATGVAINDARSAGLVEIKGDKVTFLSAKERLQRGHIGESERATAAIDIVHTAIALTERNGVESADSYLEGRFVDTDDGDFKGALEALLRIMRRSEDDYPPALSLWRYLYQEPPPERLDAQLELDLPPSDD